MKRWVNLALAIAFLIVGILTTASMIRFNNYVKATLPRDQAQEQCNTETIATLKEWAIARAKRDESAMARDDVAVSILNHMLVGEQPTDEELTFWRNAIEKDQATRAQYKAELNLPIC